MEDVDREGAVAVESGTVGGGLRRHQGRPQGEGDPAAIEVGRLDLAAPRTGRWPNLRTPSRQSLLRSGLEGHATTLGISSCSRWPPGQVLGSGCFPQTYSHSRTLARRRMLPPQGVKAIGPSLQLSAVLEPPGSGIACFYSEVSILG